MKKKISFVFLVLFLFHILSVPILFAKDNYDFVNNDVTYEKNKNINNLCGANAGGNVKSSIVMSAVTLCLPGVLEKTYEYAQFKCQRIVCEYEAVKYGLDPTFCTKQYQYKTCKYIVGEAFAFPPMAILEYYRKMISDLMANPVGALYSVVTTSARAKVYGSCTAPTLSCHSAINLDMGLAKGILLITDSAALLQTIKDMMENGFFPPGIADQKDYCSKIGDIKKEMEQIVDTYQLN